MFFVLNLILAVFNLLPVPPLDGSGAVLLFLRKDQVASYQNLLRHPLMSVVGSARGLVLVQSALVAGVESCSAPALSLSRLRPERCAC